MNTPTINLNLAACGCGLADRAPTYPPTPHQDHCPAKHVELPCPIPRSVTFQVVLGECVCGGHIGRGPPAIIDRRSAACPARPISVTCSISGETWARSEVATDTDERPTLTHDQRFLAAHACNSRWALVKALVMGQMFSPENPKHAPERHAALVRLVAQRDALYAALCKMARHETGLWEGLQEAFEAFPASRELRSRTREPLEAPSAIVLMGYVKRLVEQVGNLEGGT